MDTKQENSSFADSPNDGTDCEALSYEVESPLDPPSLEKMIQKARSGDLDDELDPEVIAQWLEGLDSEGKRMIELAVNYAFLEGFEVGADQWGRP